MLRLISLLLFLLLSAVSTCITTCKKIAPPPVPPRTTSKPFISVTVQSSTESAQDGYLDNHDRKSEVNSQSGHSNSSDSLDSTRANSLAKISRPQLPLATGREPQIPAAVVVSPEPLRGPHNEQVKGGALAADEPRIEPVPRRKLSSIGIQVDGQFRLLYHFSQILARIYPFIFFPALLFEFSLG